MISVVGLSVFGLAFAASVANAGYQVLCTDMDEEVVNGIRDGEMPAFETGLGKLVSDTLASGNLILEANLRRVIRDSHMIFITCLVPEDEEEIMGSLRFVNAIVGSITRQMESDKIIVLKSTVPPGANEKVTELAQKNLLEREWAPEQTVPKCQVVSSPSFARPGMLVRDMERPRNAVIGASKETDVDELVAIYRKLGTRANKIFCTEPANAEMSVYFIEGMVALKTAYVNEMALLFDKLGVDMNIQRKIIDIDPRFSSQLIQPGVGYGGKDRPKQIRTLIEIGENCGEELVTLKGAVAANEKQQVKAFNRIVDAMDGIEGKTLGVMGITSAQGNDDLKEAPSVTIVKKLVEAGAKIRMYSREGFQEAKWRFYNEREAITFCDEISAAAEAADGLVVLSPWANVSQVNMRHLRKAMIGDVLIDLCNIFAKRKDVETIFDYYPLGIKLED